MHFFPFQEISALNHLNKEIPVDEMIIDRVRFTFSRWSGGAGNRIKEVWQANSDTMDQSGFASSGWSGKYEKDWFGQG